MSTLPTYDQLADLLSEARTLLSSQERPPHPDQASHVIGFLDRADAALSPIAERDTPTAPARSPLRSWLIEGNMHWSGGFSVTVSALTEDVARGLAQEEAIETADPSQAELQEVCITSVQEVRRAP